VLNQDVFTLNAGFSISTTDLSLNVKGTLDLDVLGVLRVGGEGNLSMNKDGILLTANASARIFNSISLERGVRSQHEDFPLSLRGQRQFSGRLR